MTLPADRRAAHRHPSAQKISPHSLRHQLRHRAARRRRPRPRHSRCHGARRRAAPRARTAAPATTATATPTYTTGEVLRLDVEDLDIPAKRARTRSKGGDVDWLFFGSGSARLLAQSRRAHRRSR
jgi:hypothetical protein